MAWERGDACEASAAMNPRQGLVSAIGCRRPEHLQPGAAGSHVRQEIKVQRASSDAHM